MNTTLLWLYRLLTRFLPPTRFFGLKSRFLRLCGAVVGKNVRIVSDVIIMGDGQLQIGDDVWIGSGTRIFSAGDGLISIGSNVDIAPQVTLLTGSHMIEPHGVHLAGKGFNGVVRIGDGSWLGARSMVLPNVTIPPRTLVAAGSVVSKSISEGGVKLVAGVPACVKKSYA